MKLTSNLCTDKDVGVQLAQPIVCRVYQGAFPVGNVVSDGSVHHAIVSRDCGEYVEVKALFTTVVTASG